MFGRIKNIPKKICKKDGFFTFMRAQFSSQISSATDFLVTIVLAKVFDVYYVVATSLGAFVGGIVNCTVNYYWTFKSKECKKKYVLIKYTFRYLFLIIYISMDRQYLPEYMGCLLDDGIYSTCSLGTGNTGSVL